MNVAEYRLENNRMQKTRVEQSLTKTGLAKVRHKFRSEYQNKPLRFKKVCSQTACVVDVTHLDKTYNQSGYKVSKEQQSKGLGFTMTES